MDVLALPLLPLLLGTAAPLLGIGRLLTRGV